MSIGIAKTQVVSKSGSGGGGTAAWATLTGDLTEAQVIPFDGGFIGTPDTGISRLAPATLAIGDGTTGDSSGTLQLTTVQDGQGEFITLDPGTNIITIQDQASDSIVLDGNFGTLTVEDFSTNSIEMNGGGLALTGGPGLIVTLSDSNSDAIFIDPGPGIVNIQATTGVNITVLGGTSSFLIGSDVTISPQIAIAFISPGGLLDNSGINQFTGKATVASSTSSIAVVFSSAYAGTNPPIIVITPIGSGGLSAAAGASVSNTGSAGAWTGFTIHTVSSLVSNITFNWIAIGQL